MSQQLVANTDLTTTGVSAGTYGNSAYHPVVTVGTDGRITSVTNTVITISTNASDITVTGNVTANSIIPTSTAKPQNGLYLAAANSLGFSANAIASFSIDGTGSLNLSKSYTEGVVSIGNSGASQTLSLANGTLQTTTLTANCTFTMPTITAGKSFTLIANTGTGNFTTTTFTSVKWSGGTAPTVTNTANRWDIFTFFSDGTNWYGNASQNFS